MEAMCVDDDASQLKINQSSERELSTPEQPSGPSLEERCPPLVSNNIIASIGPESVDSYDNQSVKAETMQVGKHTITEHNVSDLRRNTTLENYHYAHVPSNEIDPTMVINQGSTSESKPWEVSTVAQPNLRSNYELASSHTGSQKQPSTPERPSGSSLEERYPSSNPRNSTIFDNENQGDGQRLGEIVAEVVNQTIGSEADEPSTGSLTEGDSATSNAREDIGVVDLTSEKLSTDQISVEEQVAENKSATTNTCIYEHVCDSEQLSDPLREEQGSTHK